MGNKVQFRITGKTGQIDGYMELILGTLMVAGILFKQPKIGIKTRPGGISQIYVDLDIDRPPLGNLGENDLNEYTGDQE